MTWNGVLSDLEQLHADRHDLARAEKQAGRGIWGYTSACVPQEILAAADLRPVQLTIDGRAEYTEQGKRFNPYYYCLIAQDWLGQIQNGVYDYLDGLVHADICSPGRSIIEAVNYLELTPTSFALSYPTESNTTTRNFFVTELGQLARFIEQTTGRQITDDALWAAIRLYRERTKLLRRFGRLREEVGSPLTGSQAVRVVLAGLTAEVGRFNQLLTDLLAAAEGREPAGDGRVRVMVSSLLPEAAVGLIDLIEELGGLVAVDDFCLGPRLFAGEETQVFEGDPYRHLANEYLGRVPAPYRVSQEYRNELLVNQAMRGRVAGVISLLPRYCQPAILQYPALEKRLKALGVKTLRLEDGMNEETTRTRVAALLEACR